MMETEIEAEKKLNTLSNCENNIIKSRQQQIT